VPKCAPTVSFGMLTGPTWVNRQYMNALFEGEYRKVGISPQLIY